MRVRVLVGREPWAGGGSGAGGLRAGCPWVVGLGARGAAQSNHVSFGFYPREGRYMV